MLLPFDGYRRPGCAGREPFVAPPERGGLVGCEVAILFALSQMACAGSSVLAQQVRAGREIDVRCRVVAEANLRSLIQAKDKVQQQ